MAKKEKPKYNEAQSKAIDAVKAILTKEILRKGINSSIAEEVERKEPLTDTEKVAEIKNFFNAKENSGIESEEIVSQLHAVAFNPTEVDKDKIEKITSILAD
jgi:hypothetical protein